MTEPLVLIGGGGHAKVVFDAATAARLTIEGFLDDDPHAALHALSVACLGSLPDWKRSDRTARLMPAIGDNATRREFALSLLDGRDTRELGTVIHPSAVVSRHDVLISGGVFIGPGAIINPGVRIGAGAIINSGAIVEHDVSIGDWAHIGPGSALGGAARVGNQSLVGLGSRVLPGKRIGAEVTIGAGSVVTRDIARGLTVRGAPARAH